MRLLRSLCSLAMTNFRNDGGCTMTEFRGFRELNKIAPSALLPRNDGICAMTDF